MNEMITLTFQHLSIFFTIGVFYSASVAILTSQLVKTAGWTRPYTVKQEKVLQWTPALASAALGSVGFPFLYSIIVTHVTSYQWYIAGVPIGFMAGLLSKPAYYLLKKRLAPAIVEGSESQLKRG